MSLTIAEHHLEHWRTHGYVAVPDFLDADTLRAAIDEIHEFAPTWQQLQCAPDEYTQLDDRPAHYEFPFMGDTLNSLSTHPCLLTFVEDLLGTSELAMGRSLVWTKYAGTMDFNQPLHADYPNNTLTYPRDEGVFRQVPVIIYLTDVTIDLGPTYVLSNEHATDEILVPSRYSVEERPELYTHEQPVTVTAGSLVLYSMRTLHRGSAMTASEGVRYSLHTVYQAAGLPWMGYSAWSSQGGTPAMNRFLERATPRQRELLGFPAPGHAYWSDDTLAGVAARYPGMDMTPYVEAFRGEPR